MASLSAACLKVGPSSVVSIAKNSSSRASLGPVCSSLPRSSTGPASRAIASSSSSWGRQRADYVRQTKGMSAHASVALETCDTTKVQTGQWTWIFEDSQISIHYKAYLQDETGPTTTLLFLPTISDVSTTDEWQAVAKGLLGKPGPVRYQIVAVDWPGLGLSERPSIQYTADVLERFLVDMVFATDGPLASSVGLPVLIGGGHAATIAARALSKGLIEARALAAVAPTWAGPLPIVFGRSPNMEFRYRLLRDTLRSPVVGWAMYKYLVSSAKNIRLQYVTHVYANADNVTPDFVENRTALTQRDGARYAPAAFLTGLLDPTTSREELLDTFAKLDGRLPALVISTIKSPRRSRTEMEALEGAKGVTKFVKLPGALLPQEEYPDSVIQELLQFLERYVV